MLKTSTHALAQTAPETERTQLLIVGIALVLGPATFLAAVLFLRHGPIGFAGADTAPLLTYISAGMTLCGTAGALLVPRPAGASFAKIRAWAIVRMAVAEGGALFAIVAYLLEGMPLALAGALLTLAVMAGILLPTHGRVLAWTEHSGA